MGRFLKVAILINALWVNTGFPQSNGSKPQPSASKTTRKFEYGIASYYADKFNGRSMANGEIFNQKKMTAASNTIALNTWVKVTNLHNMKSAVVKITDRMYRKNRRLIDLSKSAARILD